MRIPFVDLYAQYKTVQPYIDEAIANAIKQSAFIGGAPVKNFEEAFKSLYGVDHVISCANGTDSLYILMKMLGIGPGDEVITVANSWISSSETITQTGAKPVFVDIEPYYFSLDETKLEAAITSRTKAVIAVHLQGQMCAIDVIDRICEQKGIYLIEDCAQSHFSELNGKRAGLTGIAGSFSFYPGKNLGAYGDAGCMITNNESLAEKCRMYANHGALKKHHHQMEGINSRMDGLQAAILTAKLPHILNWTELRIRNAGFYDKYLAGIKQVITPLVRPFSKHTFHLYVVRAEQRDTLSEFLQTKEIDTAIHYPTPLPNLPCYAYLDYNGEKDFPIATCFQQQILSLPLYPEMSEEMVQYVADCIREFFQK
ncbi:MAG: DegT/DnrJ/EryC1/StrS family aminotransferase [Chitinophagaceae bacterium]